MHRTLRQFQSSVSSSAQEQKQSIFMWIGLRVGDEGWLVAAGDMAEAMISPAVSGIGNMPSGIKGIIAARGKVFTVFDMPKILTNEESVTNGESGWLTTVSPNFLSGVALWWTGLVGMMPSDSFSKNNDKKESKFSKGSLLDEQGQVWKILDIDAVLSYVGQASGLQGVA